MENNPDVFDVIQAALEKGVRTWDEYVKRNRKRLEELKMNEFDKTYFEGAVDDILSRAQKQFNPDDPEYLFQFVRELESFYHSMEDVCGESLLEKLGFEKTPSVIPQGD